MSWEMLRCSGRGHASTILNKPNYDSTVRTVALSQRIRRVHFPSAFEERTMRLESPSEEQMLGNQFGLVHTPAAKLTGWSSWR